MSDLTAAESLLGPPIETGAYRPIILADPERVVFVKRGFLDIFSVERTNETSLARAPLVCRVAAERMAFGVTPDEAEGNETNSKVLMAVPSRDANIILGERSHLNDLDRMFLEAVIWIDDWILNLTEVLAKNGLPTPRHAQLLEADTDVPYPAGSAVSAHHSDVVWVSANRPMRFVGREDMVVSAGTLMPLCERVWFELSADTEISAVRTPALINPVQLWPALDLFGALILRSTRLIDRRNNSIRRERFETRQLHREALKASILGNIGRVLGEADDGRVAAEATARNPLQTAVGLVAASVGAKLRTPQAGARGDGPAETVAQIAHLSGIRTRRIALAPDWWRRHGPSFVGNTAGDGEEAQPLAVCADGRGAFRAVDPSTGAAFAVDRKAAAGIARSGVMLYPPLPDRIESGLAALLHIVRGFGRDIRVLLAMAVLGGLVALLTPILMGRLLAEIIPRVDTSMWIAALAALGLAALGAAAFEVVTALATLRIESRTDERLQAAIWSRLLSLPAPFFRRFTAGDLAHRANGVAFIRQMLTGDAVGALVGGVFSIFSLMLLFYYSWTLALCACGAALVLAGASWFLVRFQVSHYRRAFLAQGLIDGLVFQIITGIGKLRMANAEFHALARWAERFADQRRETIAARRWAAGQFTVNAMFIPLASLFLFAFIWYALIEGETQPTFDLGDFLSFNAAFGQFAAAAIRLTAAWARVASVVPLFERVQPILENKPENLADGYVLPDLTGDIEFAQVAFRYLPDAPNAVENLSFRIRQGEYAAFVGPSGAGKSTIYRLLLGFERPDSGAVLIDGHDLLYLDLPTVRNLMGVVLQDSKLVAASIFENISGSNPLTMEEAWAAARAAGIEEDIREMPMGMHTMLPEGGTGLSGGQKQRVMIARALARKPRILLFDEATSALDNQTQAVVQESLKSLSVTRIVIAHRLSTIRDANRIFVMTAGQVVETGRYADLMARDGVFADLVRRQLI